jgi:hypothetical protein
MGVASWKKWREDQDQQGGLSGDKGEGFTRKSMLYQEKQGQDPTQRRGSLEERGDLVHLH